MTAKRKRAPPPYPYAPGQRWEPYMLVGRDVIAVDTEAATVTYLPHPPFDTLAQYTVITCSRAMFSRWRNRTKAKLAAAPHDRAIPPPT